MKLQGTHEYTAHAADEAAIHSVFDQLVACWNRGDGVAYGQLFTEDADYIDVTGTHAKGGQAIGQAHQFLFSGPLKGSKLESNSAIDVQFLVPEVAIVIGGGASQLEEHTEAPDDRQSINTTILVKRNGEWKIRAFQNNRVQRVPFAPSGSVDPQSGQAPQGGQS